MLITVYKQVVDNVNKTYTQLVDKDLQLLTGNLWISAFFVHNFSEYFVRACSYVCNFGDNQPGKK